MHFDEEVEIDRQLCGRSIEKEDVRTKLSRDFRLVFIASWILLHVDTNRDEVPVPSELDPGIGEIARPLVGAEPRFGTKRDVRLILYL